MSTDRDRTERSLAAAVATLGDVTGV
jgi:hypothetical protein